MKKTATTPNKPYSMSHLNIIIDDRQGGHAVKCIRIKGHPMNVTAYNKALGEIKSTLSNGNRILAASLTLISEQLTEKCSRVFQPNMLV